MSPPAPPAIEVEDAAKSELVFDKMPAHGIVPHVVAAARKLDKVRVYEEVARNEVARNEVARRFRPDADGIARIVVKEFDAAKLEAEIARLAAVQEQLDNSKLKSFTDAQNATRRLELKVLRRPAPRPERHERIRSIAPYADRRAIALPEISSIGCEKTTNATESAAAAAVEASVETRVETTVAAAGLATSVILASEPQVAVETSAPAVMAAPLATSTSWALGCDSEPEYTK
jgi:hypothetical protein